MRNTAHLGVTMFTCIVAASCSPTTADSAPRYEYEGPALISNVRVIDGLGNVPIDSQDILIVEGKIAAIGDTGSIEPPEGALTIDGEGMSAMPGLIDMLSAS